MAYKEFLELNESIASRIRGFERSDKVKWLFDEEIYFVQQVMFFLSEQRESGKDLNHIFDQRIAVRFDKGVDHSCKFRKKIENSVFTATSEQGIIQKT